MTGVDDKGNFNSTREMVGRGLSTMRPSHENVGFCNRHTGRLQLECPIFFTSCPLRQK